MNGSTISSLFNLFISNLAILAVLVLLVVGYFLLVLHGSNPSGRTYDLLNLVDLGCRAFWCRRNLALLAAFALGVILLVFW